MKDKYSKDNSPIAGNIGEELRLVFLTEEQTKNLNKNLQRYNDLCHLYRGYKKIDNNLYRKGGAFDPFKHGFCQLLHYGNGNSTKDSLAGVWVVINNQGEIIQRDTESFNHSFLNGCILSNNNGYTDLHTGELICKKCYEQLSTKKSIFVKVDQETVYCIDKETGKYQISNTKVVIWLAGKEYKFINN